LPVDHFNMLESENIELVDKKDVINEKIIENNDEAKFIARKERKISELREELKRHEEELLLLKKQWQTVVSKDIDSENTSSSVFSFQSNTSNNEVSAFMNGLGKGIHSVIGGIHNLKESETIKTARKSSYKSVPTTETSAIPNINTAISPTTSPPTTSPTSSISQDLIWSALNSESNSEHKPPTDKDDFINEKNLDNENIDGVLAGSPKDEFEEQLVYVIGDDLGDFV
ncbi:8015_t:CDS:2, partial [Racocetra fulgida]